MLTHTLYITESMGRGDAQLAQVILYSYQILFTLPLID